MTIKIDLISDLHGYQPEMKGGDVLIIAGDITAQDTVRNWCRFHTWFDALDYKKKIFIGGNHDGFLSQTISTKEHLDTFGGSDNLCNYEYLKDSGVEYEGIKIWGTPWTPWFRGVHPACKKFMTADKELKQKFDLIPLDTDILISHGPRFGMLDKNIDGVYCGSKALHDRTLELDLKLHVFGHIHEAYGHCYQGYHSKEGDAIGDLSGANEMFSMGYLSVNCSLMNERYEPVNKPIRIEVDECANFTLISDFY